MRVTFKHIYHNVLDALESAYHWLASNKYVQRALQSNQFRYIKEYAQKLTAAALKAYHNGLNYLYQFKWFRVSVAWWKTNISPKIRQAFDYILHARWVRIATAALVVLFIISYSFLSLFLARPQRLINSFENGKNATREAYRAMLEVQLTAESMPRDEAQFDQTINQFDTLQSSLDTNYKEPNAFVVSFALRDYRGKESELQTLANNDLSGLEDSAHTTAAEYEDLLRTLKPLFTQDQSNTALYSESYTSALSHLNSQVYEQVDVTVIRNVLATLQAELDLYTQSNNAIRWTTNRLDQESIIKQELANGWQQTQKELSAPYSEHISDYERMEYLFRSLNR